MEYRPFRHGSTFFFWIGILSAMLMSWACGGGGPSTDAIFDTGTLSFHIVYKGAEKGPRFQAAAVDCAGEGIATIEAEVYDPSFTSIAVGGPWDCDAGSGTIGSVPAGSDRTIVVLGKDDAGDIVFRGEKSGIDVVSDRENSAGTVDCTVFVPNLLTPADGSMVSDAAMGLSWQYIAGAAGYRIVVSEKSDLKDPVIDTTTTVENYTPSGLSDTKTYYWHVAAIDMFQHQGVESSVWSFTVNSNVENTSPVANITSPEQGRTFLSDTDILFAGNGNDSEDGILSGASLIWRSDVDGIIDMGETFTSDKLSPGTHHITLTVTDSEGATGLDTVVITIATGRLPDTGQTTSYTDTFGEDSDYDINAPAYTKLDASGNDLDAGAYEWAMVRDDVTGLIWEVKTDDGFIHDKDDTYTWLDAQNTFIAQLNRDRFGGHSDWRLPTIKELYNIAHKGKDYSPVINTAYFPNTMSTAYWSSTARANSTDSVWIVHFSNGSLHYMDTGDIHGHSYNVRAVRGGQNNSILVDNGDDTVTDTATGLMWQQTEAGAMNWEDALAYCENLELAGYTDWRLPNINELQSLVDFEKNFPSIDPTFFPGAESYLYWSSTTYAIEAGNGGTVSFKYGNAAYWEKSESSNVRAVRGGQ